MSCYVQRDVTRRAGASLTVEEGKVGPPLWKLRKDSVTRLGSLGTGEHHGGRVLWPIIVFCKRKLLALAG